MNPPTLLSERDSTAGSHRGSVSIRKTSPENSPAGGKMKRTYFKSMLATPLIFLLLACTHGQSSSELIEQGWQRVVNKEISKHSGQEFDYNTGELSGGPTPDLSLPGDEEKERRDYHQIALEELCKEFVDTGTIFRGKGAIVSEVLHEAWSLADRSSRSRLTEEYVNARRNIRVQVDAEIGSLDEVQLFINGEFNPAYHRIQEDRRKYAEYLLEADYPELIAERDKLREESNNFNAKIYNESQVLAIQKLIIDQCGIRVPEGYIFPTAEDLEISLDRFKDLW